MKLHKRLIVLFCLSQFISLVSVEIYMVSVIWTSSSLAGKNAGYIPALMAAALLLGSISGGLVPDRWNNQDVMRAANISRATLIALFVLFAYAHGIGLAVLVISSALVAVATALYDPALQGLIPKIVSEPAERHTLNGLLDATKQTARILGPSIVAIGSTLVGISSFFIGSAAGFLLSAVSLQLFAGQVKGDLIVSSPAPTKHNLLSGINAILSRRRMLYAITADFLGNIGWAMGVLLGMALFYQQSSREPLLLYGLMMTSMGIGSLVSNVLLVRIYPRSPAAWLIISRLIFGVGVILLPYSTSGAYIVITALFTSFNGPFHRLALLMTIQSEFTGSVVSSVYRLQMISMSSGLLIGYITSPFVFSVLGINNSIILSGALSLSLGIFGILYKLKPGRDHVGS